MSRAPRYRWIPRAGTNLDGMRATTGDALLDRILYARGYREPDAMRRYLQPLAAPMLSPFAVPGVHEAVALIRWAIARQRRIVVHGDYDADGLSATALLVLGLRSLGADVFPYVPNRFETGYGLALESVPELASAADLLITVDCGIRSVQEVRRARELGMAVIVSDHHLPGPELPGADALVSTRLPQSPVSDALSGVGVAYQIWRGLREVTRRFGATELAAGGTYLDLVAVGTVADVSPLVGENRRLVRAGLQQLREDARPGLAALSLAAGTALKDVRASSISFALAPRINAAGRLGSAEPALELLMTSDQRRATELARQLDRANRTRQGEVRRCLEAVRTAGIEDDLERSPLLFTMSDDYPQGIVGLVAGRLVDSYRVPVVAVTLEDGRAHGSVRSPDWFNASDALEACADLMDKHGGHSRAAGFTCAAEVIDRVEQRLRDQAEAVAQRGVPSAELSFDAESPLVLPDHPIWKHLELLEPLGEGNPEPAFVSRGVRVTDKSPMGREGAHWRYRLADDQGEVTAVAFAIGEDSAEVGQRVDVLYILDERTYNGHTERRLRVLDLAEPGQGG